ncbi:Litaf-like zinc finger domain-containing protein [Fusarium globosum]|uniref:Litaf-like zinc finger domain-containing protein n=1 Tax=Fusarium globosum TaxID=78864 RepID=A0A8H6D137_9HYPO|nr:Litaf-like zinc finger domain-containing protein [Fusarium globosum]
MATTKKQRFQTLFKDDASDDNNKIELFSPLESQQQTEITAFNTISQSNVVPLRKLKQWPRAVICPACRELSLTRVERKICGGTHAMAALMFAYVTADW